MKIISENSPEKIAALRAQEKVNDALRELVTNLLRIIADAGKPVSVLEQIEQVRVAYITWLDAVEKINQTPNGAAAWSGLTLSELFPREPGPQTEQEWRDWASGDPRLEYIRERDRQMENIRQIVLHEIAGTMTGLPMHGRKHQSDFHIAVNRICDEH